MSKAILVILLFVCSPHLFGQTIDDKMFEPLYKTAQNCLDESSSDCKGSFEACAAYLHDLDSDTLAANYYLMLGNLRMRSGRWDTLALELFSCAHSRNLLSGIACKLVESQFAITKYGRFTGEIDSALVRAGRALTFARACGQKDKIARANVFMGNAKLNISSYNEALKYFHEAERLYAEINDDSGMAGLMLDMSSLYSEMHEKEKARFYNIKAAEIFKSTREEMKYAIALVDLSGSYLDVKMADSALYYLPIAEKIILGRHTRAEAYMEQNYGSAYFVKKAYKKAIQHYQKSLILANQVGDKGLLVLLNNFLAEVYKSLEMPEKSYQYAFLSDSISKSLPRNFKRSLSLLYLARSAYANKKYDVSYKAFMEFYVLRDSLLGAEKRAEIAALEEAYESEKLENELLHQTKENTLLSAKNAASNKANYALVACLILLGLVAYALIGRKNTRIKAQQAIMKVKELENAQLNFELDHKSRELTTKALLIAKNNEMLQDVQDNLKAMSRNRTDSDVTHVVRKLKLSKQQENNWKAFIEQFRDLNPEFHRVLTDKYPNLSAGEMRIAALLRMGLGTKDIGAVLNITEQGVKKARYRLRKKMQMDADDMLEREIMRI